MILFQKISYLDASAQTLLEGEVLVQDGLIADFGHCLGRPEGAEVITAEGGILCPGLVDLRATWRPGEDSAAAGITSLAALPAISDPALLHCVETGSMTLLPYGAATRGGEITEYGLLQQAGAIALTDGARPISSARLMRAALSYARAFNLRIVQHPEDAELAAAGVATEGARATWMGLPGIPAAAEEICVARDIALAELTGGAVHFAHVSTGGALARIAQAKDKGLTVTCDTAPPYFDLNETAIGDYGPHTRLSPPLRAEADRQAVLAALADGTIDAIASDHIAYTEAEKSVPFALAPPGGAGFATLLAVTLAQVHAGALRLPQALALLTARPAAWLGLESGRIARGAPADLCLFDKERAWRVPAAPLPTPFAGRALEGVVLGTWKAGRRVFG